MRPSTVGRRYAEAAFQVAQKENQVERWIADLTSAERTLSDPSVARLFKDPNIPLEDKLRTLDRLFPSFPDSTTNLLRMLASRYRLQLVPSILEDMRALDRQARGVLQAEVTVARGLTEDEQNDIQQRLHRLTGKTVELKTQVNESILGGVIVRVGDRLFDGSIAGRLERLRHRMAV